VPVKRCLPDERRSAAKREACPARTVEAGGMAG
jgi:hypothetical protein